MSEKANYRMERIERLLKELQYEVTRGILEREIDEWIGFSFYVPMSRESAGSVVFCEFRTEPVQRWGIDPADMQPRLKVVK